MQKSITRYFILAVFSAFFWQCSETKEVDPAQQVDLFFPLQVGEYRIYQVEGTKYSVNDDSLFTYQLKESVVESFSNLESGISYKILREKKYDDSESWQFDSLWTARTEGQKAIMVENNVPLVKLAFPLQDSLSWDGNSLNDKNYDLLTMLMVNKSFSGVFGTYDNTATVIQEYLPDINVNWISRKEVYAETIGLVYKENIVLIYNQSAIGAEIVDAGIRYYQHLIEYGKE
jgi:hypothetical protein